MPRHATGLRVVIRPDTGSLTIVGTVNGQRIRQSAKSSRPDLAREEAAALETKLLRTDWHGERRGDHSFAKAVTSWAEAAPRSLGEVKRLDRLLATLGDVKLRDIDQDTIIWLRRRMLCPGAAPATLTREIISPLRMILRYAARRKWCDLPVFEIPKTTPGRTNYLLPAEADRLIEAAAPHLRPLLIFLLGTGARMAEALELDWRDVDLTGARAIFWKTKNGPRRDAFLCPRVVVALANLPGDRDGKIFRWQVGTRQQVYADHERASGGQIKTGWRGALRRAGLSGLTPHDLRHTWASWHYAVNRDLLLLKTEGGWSTVKLVERYAHLLPVGHEAGIKAFWHESDTGSDTAKLKA